MRGFDEMNSTRRRWWWWWLGHTRDMDVGHNANITFGEVPPLCFLIFPPQCESFTNAPAQKGHGQNETYNRGVSLDALWGVLSTPPVFAASTLHTELMEAATGHYYTALRNHTTSTSSSSSTSTSTSTSSRSSSGRGSSGRGGVQ